MSDSYEIDGVTLTPAGGGWYELAHASIPDGEKVQGKENADARAKEIAAAAATGGDQAQVQQSDFEAAAAALASPPADDQSAKIAELEARIAELQSAQVPGGVKTVAATEGEAPPVSAKVPGGVPRAYVGILDDKAKAELKRLGVETTEIILEENETIPPTGLFLGHNGRGYNITPGVPVTVPNFLLNVLNDAVMSAPVVDPKTQKVLGYRNRLKYPYREVK